MDLDRATARDALSALASGELSSRELLEAQVARVEALNPSINAIVTVDIERAQSEAAAVDRKRSAGESLGPLAGLPMTVKDTIEVAGIRTTAGAPELSAHVPERDADVVANLRAAGAIVFGKSNSPYMAGDWQTFNEIFGRTNNPWDVARTVGGSSGGSAAAVACGFSLLEVGSDIAGSIRIPAGFNGVLGHKPSYGLVSQSGHIPPPPGVLSRPDLAVVGPLARSVDDLELGLDVLVARNAFGGVPGASLPAAEPRLAAPRGCRLGLWLDDGVSPVSHEVGAALAELVSDLRLHGMAIDESARLDFPSADAHAVYMQLLMPLMLLGMPPAQLEEMLGPDATGNAAQLGAQMSLSHLQWLGVNEQRARLQQAWAQLFERVDVVLAPTAPCVAPLHDTEALLTERILEIDGVVRPYTDHAFWAGIATAPLLPSTAALAGCSTAGLPIGVQVIGPRWGDRTTLAVARHIEALRPYEAPPG